MRKAKFSIIISAFFSSILLLFYILQHELLLITGRDLANHPRDFSQIYGILTMNLVHKDFSHFGSNIISFFVLVFLLYFFYNKVFLRVLIFITLFTGIGVFAFAAGGYHIGVSGVIFGLITFLISGGFIKQNRALLTASFVVVMFYGGTLWGVLPYSPEISWEGHLAGAIGGLVAAIIWRNKGPHRDLYLPLLRRRRIEDDEYMRFNS